MTICVIRNWDQFQHYKDRNPPWIKLHFGLLASADWVVLDDAARVLAIACMLIASRSAGKLDCSEAGLSYLRRVAYLNDQPNIKPLIDCGFLVVEKDRRKPTLASASASVITETEERRDREETEERRVVAAKVAAPLTPQAAFVEKFRHTYEARTAQPYKADTKDFVMAAGLIKRYTTDACEVKAMILADLCEKRTAWFTKKDGWSSYTLGKLSQFWNEILPRVAEPTKEEALSEEMAKWRRT